MTAFQLTDTLIDIAIQADGLGGFLSALFTVTPLSVFAQVRSCPKFCRRLSDQGHRIMALSPSPDAPVALPDGGVASSSSSSEL